MPLDPEELGTTARDFVLNLIKTNTPGSTIEVGLLNGDPAIGGVELDPVDCPGYTRFVPASWAALWAGVSANALTSNTCTFGTPTDVWNDSGSWDALYIDGYLWDSEEMATPIIVTAAGDPATATIVRAFGEAV